MKVTVYNVKGEKVKDMDLNPAIFEVKVKPELVQQAIVVQQANSRQNLAHAKDRSEIQGGGRKPWRQKGTGRARHGSIRSPLWRGGGVTFGPSKIRNFSLKINKKAKRKALLMGLSDKASNQKIVLLDQLAIEEAKTKKFFEILQNLKLRDIKKSKNQEIKKSKNQEEDKKKSSKGQKVKKGKEKSVLVVLPKKDEKIKRAAKNIPRVNIIQADSLNILDIVKSQILLLPVDSIEKIKKTFVSPYTKAPASVKTSPYVNTSGDRSAGRSGDKK